MHSKYIWCILLTILINTAFISPVSSRELVEYYSSENILKFADHLWTQGDYLRAVGEYQRYLFYRPNAREEIRYRIALCYRLGGRSERAIESFEKYIQEFPESKLVSGAYYQVGVSYFLLQQFDDSVKYLESSFSRIIDVRYKTESQQLIGLSYLMQQQWRDAEKIFVELQESDTLAIREKALVYRNYAVQGANLRTRSPFLAGFLSTLVPGAGRLYTGRVGDAVNSVLLVGLTGWQTYDGFRRNGISSVKGWTLGTLSTVFYIGNIYGSAISARLYNREITEDFLSGLSIELAY